MTSVVFVFVCLPRPQDGSQHIFEMESVRGQLQTMLHTSRDTAYRKSALP